MLTVAVSYLRGPCDTAMVTVRGCTLRVSGCRYRFSRLFNHLHRCLLRDRRCGSQVTMLPLARWQPRPNTSSGRSLARTPLRTIEVGIVSTIVIITLSSAPVMNVRLLNQWLAVLARSRGRAHKVISLLLPPLLLVVITCLRIIMDLLSLVLPTRICVMNVLSGGQWRFPSNILLSVFHVIVRHSRLAIRHQNRHWFSWRCVLSVDSVSIVVV